MNTFEKIAHLARIETLKKYAAAGNDEGMGTGAKIGLGLGGLLGAGTGAYFAPKAVRGIINKLSRGKRLQAAKLLRSKRHAYSSAYKRYSADKGAFEAAQSQVDKAEKKMKLIKALQQEEIDDFMRPKPMSRKPIEPEVPFTPTKNYQLGQEAQAKAQRQLSKSEKKMKLIKALQQEEIDNFMTGRTKTPSNPQAGLFEYGAKASNISNAQNAAKIKADKYKKKLGLIKSLQQEEMGRAKTPQTPVNSTQINPHAGLFEYGARAGKLDDIYASADKNLSGLKDKLRSASDRRAKSARFTSKQIDREDVAQALNDKAKDAFDKAVIQGNRYGAIGGGAIGGGLGAYAGSQLD